MARRETKAERVERERIESLVAVVPLRSGMEPPKPLPVLANGYVEGWTANAHPSAYGEPYRGVERAWTTCVLHGSGAYPVDRHKEGRSASQGSVSLYATESEAWTVVRLAIERTFAERLVAVDEKIRNTHPPREVRP